MNLYHLKYFYDAAKTGSMTKAAKINRVGQPAISKAILNLEAVFKKNLVSHERNRFQLTEDGAMVFSYCEKIFQSTDELRDAFEKTQIHAGEVRVACPSSMAESSFVLSFLEQVCKKYSDIKLKFMLGRTDLVCEWVRTGVVDLGLTLDNVELTDFESERLQSGFHHLIKHKDFKGDWRHEGVLTVENKPEVIELRRLYKSTYGEHMKTRMEIGSWSVIKKFVMRGMGVGFVPDYMIQDEINQHALRFVEPQNFRVPYEIHMVRKPGRYLPQRCHAVIAELKGCANK